MAVDTRQLLWNLIVSVCVLIRMDSVASVFTEYRNIANVEHYSECCGAVGCQPEGQPNYYRYIEPSSTDPRVIYVGAMNVLLALNTSNLSCVGKGKYFPPEPHAIKSCTQDKKSEIPDCQNHIRAVFKKDGIVGLCGTGAYANLSYHIALPRYSLVESGAAICPHDPFDNYTVLHSMHGNPGNSSAMYLGTYSDFYNSHIFLRTEYTSKRGDYRRITTDPSWLDGPQFVGTFDMADSVLTFFRESSRNDLYPETIVYSRVGKVCKNDLGGGSGRWLSFQKARLICSLPGAQPYYFDNIHDVVFDKQKHFYALFYKHGAELSPSAICVYELDDIRAAFEGDFGFENGSSGSPSPKPRLDDCSLHDKNTNIFDGMTSQYHLMCKGIQPVSGKPIFHKGGLQFLRMALGPSTGNYRNIYVGTSDGEIYDIFVNQSDWSTYLNAKLLPFESTQPSKRPIWKLMLKGKYLILGTDNSVTKVPLDRCNEISAISSLDECLYNTRCKLMLCNNGRICVQLHDQERSDCEYLTAANVPEGEIVRKYLLDKVKFIENKTTRFAFPDLHIELPISYPLRLEGIKWKRHGIVLDKPGKYAFSKNDLVIENIDKDDAGEYVAEDITGHVIERITVDVICSDRGIVNTEPTAKSDVLCV